VKFNYQARTTKGEIQSGIVEASSREAATTLLRKHGLYVTILEEVTAPPLYAKKIKIFEKISRSDIVLFSRQLSIMFKSKVPLVEALKVLSAQTASSELKEKILELSEEVEGGTSFSGALSRYPKIFSSFYIAMVKSGEISGTLSESLEYLAEHLEREYHLTAKMRGALMYPSLIVFVVFLTLALMIFFVIPHLSEVLIGTGQELPTITKVVIGSAAFFRAWGWAIFLGIVVLILAGFRYYRTEKGKNLFDRTFLKLPIIGPFFKMLYIARFAENLSTLISGGLPIASALQTVGEIVGNTRYKEVIFNARDKVRKGESISSVLARSPEVFSPVFIQMILVGEKTGTLDSTLMNIVNFYKKEIDRTIDNFLSILEPTLIVILGVIVAGLMLAILIPLYQMVAF
jgi:type II secretory pathway component PulF